MKANISLFQALLLTCLIGILIIGLRFLGDIDRIQKVNKAEMFYKITHDFFISDSTNKGLIKALGDGTPIFKENGGKYDVYNVDDYLSHFDLLKNYLDEGIVPEKDIYDSYSYYIVQAYQNKEIWEYVTGLRRDYKDSTFYANVELLAKRFIEENKKQIYSH